MGVLGWLLLLRYFRFAMPTPERMLSMEGVERSAMSRSRVRPKTTPWEHFDIVVVKLISAVEWSVGRGRFVSILKHLLFTPVRERV